MHLPRRLTVTLTAAALALGAAGPVWAQSAGDEQYSDPLAQTGTGTSSTATPTTSMPSLTGAPAAGTQPSSAGAAPGAGTSTPAAGTTAAAELPRTGSDTLVAGLLGAALVLFGIGLRLRVGDAGR